MASPVILPETQMKLGNMMHELLHGEDREVVADVLTKKFPEYKLQMPDVEIKKLEKRLRDEREQEKQEIENQKMVSRLERQRQKLVDSGKYTSEDVEKIESYMQERGIGDYEDGATLYGARHAPAASTPEIKTSKWEMPSFKGLAENPNKWANDEAYKAIGELRNNRR